MTTTENAFGKLLEVYRAAKGWTKAQLAERAGLDPSAISRLESGQRVPERQTVALVADALELSPLDRERLYAAAGYRSDAWDDSLVAELVEVLADPAIPDEIKSEVRAVVRVALRYARLAAQQKGS
ncbi:MAG: XRE family transcriptional regulator [Chloroflexota bacterium]